MQTYPSRIKTFKCLSKWHQKTLKHLFKLLTLKVYLLGIVLLTPLCYLVFVRDVLEGKNFNLIGLVVGGYIGLYVLETLGIVLQKRFQNTFFMPLKLSVRKQMSRKLSLMAPEDYKRYQVGDLKQRLDVDVEVVQTFFTTHLIEYVYAFLSALTLLFCMFTINWILTLIGLVAVPLSFLFASFMSKKPGRIEKEYRDKYGAYETDVHNSFQNWRMIKSHGLEQHESKMLKRHWDGLTKLFIKKQVFWFINRSFIAIKDTFITTMNLYFVGGILVMQGQLEVGLLLMFMNYYAKFYANIEQMIQSIMSYKTDAASLVKVMEILDLEVEKTDARVCASGNLVVRDLSFAYSDHARALEDVNMVVEKNTHLAIVGRSGAGKSTLIKMFTGALKPTSGDILLGEESIDQMSMESLSKRMAVVMQEPYFFNFSIAENLKMAKKSASMEDLIEVCEQTNIHSFISDLPLGYDTLIGEKGIKLSGGQRQRLAIARMLLMGSDILIFDEATSALDHENEQSIVKALTQVKSKKTIISIAHRLSTIASADQVLVLDKGRVVSQGTHQSLSESCEVYQNLFKNEEVS